MRKFIIISLVALFTFACGPGKKLTIVGTVVDSTLNGKLAYMYDYNTEKNIDSCEVVEGKFTLRVADISDGVVYKVNIDRLMTNVVAEPGTVNVILDRKSQVSGTPLNERYETFRNESQDRMEEFRTKYQALVQAEDDDSVQALYEEFQKTELERKNLLLEENKDNPIGAMMALAIISEGELSVAEIDETIAKAGKFAVNFKEVQKFRTLAVNTEKTVEGSMFSDFEGTTPDGKPIKLSDYVGKGNYVLADFWASWCGPCRAEMPNLVEIYNEYSKKGLVVLGINVWDEKEPFEKAVADLGIVWNNICTFDDKTATEVYGIRGVPHIMLFAPDGTIVKRGLRGEEMKAMIADIYKEQ